MKRFLVTALCLFVFSTSLVAGEISIPGKCDNCASQPAPTPPPLTGKIPMGPIIGTLLGALLF